MYLGQRLWGPESFDSSTGESKPTTRPQCKGLAWISLMVPRDFNVGHLYRRPCHKAEPSTETGLLLHVQEHHREQHSKEILFSYTHKVQDKHT